jgi:hypothetical protein
MRSQPIGTALALSLAAALFAAVTIGPEPRVVVAETPDSGTPPRPSRPKGGVAPAPPTAPPVEPGAVVTPATPPAPIGFAQITSAVHDYVVADTKLKGGYFLLWDSEQKSVLRLAYTNVRLENVGRTSDGRHVACCDFAGVDGHNYNLDFWVRSVNGQLVVEEIRIHMMDQNPRYHLRQAQGTFFTRPLEPSDSAAPR